MLRNAVMNDAATEDAVTRTVDQGSYIVATLLRCRLSPSSCRTWTAEKELVISYIVSYNVAVWKNKRSQAKLSY